MQNLKEWWERLHEWLITNQKSRHYRTMKNAIWLFLYFLANADRATGELARTLETLSSVMGISRRTIQRWLGTLRDEGYVKTRSNGRLIIIAIENWNGLTDGTNLSDKTGRKSPTGDDQNGSSDSASNTQNAAHSSQKGELSDKLVANPAIDISIKNKLNIDIDKENSLRPSPSPPYSISSLPKNREDLLALDLAEALDDLAGLPLYLTYARKYPEPYLRRILGVVKEIPPEKVKRSRGALFNYLVQKHGKPNQNHSGD